MWVDSFFSPVMWYIPPVEFHSLLSLHNLLKHLASFEQFPFLFILVSSCSLPFHIRLVLTDDEMCASVSLHYSYCDSFISSLPFPSMIHLFSLLGINGALLQSFSLIFVSKILAAVFDLHWYFSHSLSVIRNEIEIGVRSYWRHSVLISLKLLQSWFFIFPYMHG